MVSDFQGDCCSSLGNKNIFAIEMRKRFTEPATERDSLNLRLAAIIQIK